MIVRACVLTLLIVWPVLVAAGYGFYRHMQKTRPQPLKSGDPRAPLVRPFRFLMFVVLLPLGVTIALALLGFLDPLFYFLKSWLY